MVARHQIPAALFDTLIEGFACDCEGRRYDTTESLHDYAARVAGTVGAMMALLMDVRSPDALVRARDFGVAIQLSNIARCVGEDARMRRLNLPRTRMLEAGVEPDAWLAKPTFSAALAMMCRAWSMRPRRCTGVSMPAAQLPLACRPGINAARLLYAEIGHEVARRGFDSVSARAHVWARRKLGLLLLLLLLLRSTRSPRARAGVGAAWPGRPNRADAQTVGPARAAQPRARRRAGPMSSDQSVGLEMALVLGVVVGPAVWELVRLRRDRKAPPESRPPE